MSENNGKAIEKRLNHARRRIGEVQKAEQVARGEGSNTQYENSKKSPLKNAQTKYITYKEGTAENYTGRVDNNADVIRGETFKTKHMTATQVELVNEARRRTAVNSRIRDKKAAARTQSA